MNGGTENPLLYGKEKIKIYRKKHKQNQAVIIVYRNKPN